MAVCERRDGDVAIFKVGTDGTIAFVSTCEFRKATRIRAFRYGRPLFEEWHETSSHVVALSRAGCSEVLFNV